MNSTEINDDYIELLIFDSEHCAATVEEAYENVSKWLNEFELL